MAHKYYCTHCARELDQDRVLMDMEYALTVNSEEGEEGEKFRLLKFLVTIQEFQDLLAKGTPGDLGYLHFDLSVDICDISREIYVSLLKSSSWTGRIGISLTRAQ